jgi:hypothetical protein
MFCSVIAGAYPVQLQVLPGLLTFLTKLVFCSILSSMTIGAGQPALLSDARFLVGLEIAGSPSRYL